MWQIVDATQIDKWFSSARRRAQGLLPHLVRKLVFETVNIESLVSIKFPVGDQIQRPGYDGRLETTAVHLYLPMGKSVWEMGTGKRPKIKADSDYGRRTKDPKDIDPRTTIFVFVTPHPWNAKDDWANGKRKEGAWKDIRVYDVEDLATWLLELAPHASGWLAREMGFPTEGIHDLETFIREELQARYGVQLPRELLVGGRDETAAELQDWIDSDSREVRVEGESIEEASLFVAAVVMSLHDKQKQQLVESRLLFVSTPEVLDRIASLQTSYFVVCITPEVRRRARAINSPALRTIVPEARAAGDAMQSRPSLKLGPIRRQSCEQALVSMGLASHQAARTARESKGSLAAILWMVAEVQDNPPPWTTSEAALELVPLVIAGQWSPENEPDRAAVEKLADRKYEEIERSLAKWAAPAGPLILRGETWDWLAWDYAWARLTAFIDSRQIKRFCEIAIDVLGTPDPRLELAADQRWAAAIYGKRHPYSAVLRTGLVGSVAQFALNSQGIRGQDGQSIANVIVCDLLDGQKLPRKVTWLSLGQWLPDLAEAAPDSFLEALDKLLVDAEAMTGLFEQGGIFGTSEHVHLLWALERLAWSENYLTRVTLLLGDLAAIDPGGQMSNRPSGSLTGIFLPWYPQTAAGPQHRLDAIDELYNRQPEITWALAVSLLPKYRGLASPTAEPHWRLWEPEGEIKVAPDEYWHFINVLLSRMIVWAGDSGVRWSELVESYDVLHRQCPELAKLLLSSLQQLNAADLGETDRAALSGSVREILSKHRELPDAEWAMNEEQLRPFDDLYDKFQPRDPIEQYSWLFASWPGLPRYRGSDYQQQIKRLQEDREKAVRAIYEAQGLDGLLRLAEKVERPDEVGLALSRLAIGEVVEADLLRITLNLVATKENIPARLRMGLGYVNGSYHGSGNAWIEKVLALDSVSWDANRWANLAFGLPPEGPTWDRLAGWGEEAENQYWSWVSIHYLEEPERDAERAIRRLLQVGRPYCALDLTFMCIYEIEREGPKARSLLPISTELILEVLQEGPKHDPNEEWYPPTIGMIPYHVEYLLDILEREGLESSVMASLDWAWMPALEHGRRGLKALQHALSTQPELFVEILKLVFRGEKEERGDVSEQQQARATQAYRLLTGWNRVPGTIEEQPIDERSEGDITFRQGQVDYDELFTWVSKARRLAEDCGRLSVCDSRIGSVLAHAPQDTDGRWPCEPVRRLVEELKSEELERGLQIGIYNKRGVHARERGGEQERRLEAKFRRYAEQVISKWPRTAAVLNRVADGYKLEAKRYDEEEAIREFE